MIAMTLTVLLAATLLAMSLLHLPGGVRKQMSRLERDIVEVYRDESAIIAWLERFPAEYFAKEPWNMQLPEVVEEDDFPWKKVYVPMENSSRRIVARVGAVPRLLDYNELRETADLLEANLKREILGRKNLKVKSGSRRLTGRGENAALLNTAGNVTLEFNGNVESVNIKCDGDINVMGSARYDSLRLYASGDVKLKGAINVKHLEVFSGGDVELSRAVSFSGIVYSRGNISPMDCADGTGGQIHLVSQYVPDVPEASSRRPLCILPVSLGGKMRALSWSME